MPPLSVLTEEFLKPFVLQAAIDPISQGAGTITTPWVNAASFQGIVALIQTGVLGAAATVNAKLQQAQDAGGTGAQDIAGKAITQIVKATGDNKQAVIIASRNQINIGGGYPYVRLSLTVGTAASLVAAQLFGVYSIYGPQLPTQMPASVVELVR